MLCQFPFNCVHILHWMLHWRQITAQNHAAMVEAAHHLRRTANSRDNWNWEKAGQKRLWGRLSSSSSATRSPRTFVLKPSSGNSSVAWQNCWFPKIQVPLKHPFWYYFHYISIFCLIHPGVWLRPLLREKHHSSPPRRRNQGRAGEVCTTCFHQIQRVISSEMIPNRLIFSVCLRNRDRCREAVQEAQCISTMHTHLYRYKDISYTINISNIIIFPNRSNII